VTFGLILVVSVRHRRMRCCRCIMNIVIVTFSIQVSFHAPYAGDSAVVHPV